jgi:spore coat protein A
MWMDEITENPMVGDTEVWEIYNFTADAHPIHLHEVQFQVVNRQPLLADEEGMTLAPATLAGPPTGPEPSETGYKDTVIAYPGQVTRIKATFDLPGLYVWHCHIVEHEDNEMMRPYFIGPMR